MATAKSTTKKLASKKTTTKLPKAQYDAMNSLFVWNFNYDHNFIEKVWGKGTVIANHLQAKFSSIYKAKGSYAAGMVFVGELDTENRAKLFEFIVKRHKK